MSLSSLRKFATLGFVNDKREIAAARDLSKKLQVKTSSLEALVKHLSGGNQQKVVLGKCLLAQPKILILDEPTRGIDVGTKAEIYHLIQELAAQGMAVLVASSELPEVLGVSDRVLVMAGGKIKAEMGVTDATQEKIMTAAAL